jgi:hypothetical protein
VNLQQRNCRFLRFCARLEGKLNGTVHIALPLVILIASILTSLYINVATTGLEYADLTEGPRLWSPTSTPPLMAPISVSSRMSTPNPMSKTHQTYLPSTLASSHRKFSPSLQLQPLPALPSMFYASIWPIVWTRCPHTNSAVPTGLTSSMTIFNAPASSPPSQPSKMAFSGLDVYHL